jgi:hypothetical protein
MDHVPKKDAAATFRVTLLYLVLSHSCYAHVTGNGDATEGTYLCNTAGINFVACAYNLTLFVSNTLLYYSYKTDYYNCTA